MQQSEDPRWQRFSELAWECSSCGLAHAGLFDLASDDPVFWQGSTDKRPNSAVLGADNVLTEDFCIIGQHYFVALRARSASGWVVWQSIRLWRLVLAVKKEFCSLP
jgi:hypothetical protein